MKTTKLNRHSVTLIICGGVLVLTCLLASAAWHQQVKTDNARNANTAKLRAAAADRQAMEVSALQGRIDAECQKEIKYYSLLTPLQKRAVAAPDCVGLRTLASDYVGLQTL